MLLWAGRHAWLLVGAGPPSLVVQEVSAIGPGLLVLVGIAQDDVEADLEYLARKLVALRLWDSAQGQAWAVDVTQLPSGEGVVGGGVLLVSQFTLLASTRKGTKPVFRGAMPPEPARVLFDRFAQLVGEKYRHDRGACCASPLGREGGWEGV